MVKAYRRFDADRIVAEVNQGGDMVQAVLKGIDAHLPVTAVRASRGKWLRAEPVAALYEQGRVVHAGSFPALEDQMCDFGPDGLSSGRSPDRLDALVWALTALMLEGGGEPRVRACNVVPLGYLHPLDGRRSGISSSRWMAGDPSRVRRNGYPSDRLSILCLTAADPPRQGGYCGSKGDRISRDCRRAEIAA